MRRSLLTCINMHVQAAPGKPWAYAGYKVTVYSNNEEMLNDLMWWDTVPKVWLGSETLHPRINPSQGGLGLSLSSFILSVIFAKQCTDFRTRNGIHQLLLHVRNRGLVLLHALDRSAALEWGASGTGACSAVEASVAACHARNATAGSHSCCKSLDRQQDGNLAWCTCSCRRGQPCARRKGQHGPLCPHITGSYNVTAGQAPTCALAPSNGARGTLRASRRAFVLRRR